MTEICTKSPSNLTAFEAGYSSAILSKNEFRGDLEYVVRGENILELVRSLKIECGFELLIDLFGMDYSKFGVGHGGLSVIFILYSLLNGARVRLRVSLEKPEIQSITNVFSAANWYERETWDMFGIRFIGHPDLHRILCHHDFEGHALLKSYPADHYQRLRGAISSSEI